MRTGAGVFVTGTDTGVGKTTIAAGLARWLRGEGFKVGVLKAVETGWKGGPGTWPSDARRLAAAAGFTGPPEEVVPFVYPEPVAPLLAARLAGRPVDPERVAAAFHSMAGRHDITLVEGAGGLAVPVTEGVDMAGLAYRLGLPVLVVARASLGTLNHTCLTVHYARARGLAVAGVVVNGYDPQSQDVSQPHNPGLIAELTGCPVLAVVRQLPAAGDDGGAGVAAELRRWLELPGFLQAVGAGGRRSGADREAGS